jgi:hypothetical protein
VIAVAASWLRRLLTAAPMAWRTDRIFRWASVGAALGLLMAILRLFEPDAPLSIAAIPPPSLPAPAELGSNYRPATTNALVAPTPAMPRIEPGRSLDSVTITPTPPDRFGTLPAPNPRH